MTRAISIMIDKRLDSFIYRLIDGGRFGSTSEVMFSALRLLERQEINNEALHQAVLVGLKSDESALSLRDIAAQTKLKHSLINGLLIHWMQRVTCHC